MSKTMKNALLLLNCTMLALGNCGGPLVQRLYFVKVGREFGYQADYKQLVGHSLYSQSWPLTHTVEARQPPLFFPCVVRGILTDLDDYLAAYGVSRLPVSTSALIIATQLAFTAGFAFLLVKQKFTFLTINAVFLLSVGALVLAFHSSADRPAHESNKQYFIGFFDTWSIGIIRFVLPMIELIYKKAKQPVNYSLVMEMQIVMSFFATAYALMLVNHDCMAIPREAREYELGQATYHVTLVLSAILWQLFFCGAIGVIFCASSLFSGIVMATLLPVTESLAVMFFHERFQVEKGISLSLQEIKKQKHAAG
ncbi:hypothetical protein RJ639_016861, partial [Escallonia herrerae]